MRIKRRVQAEHVSSNEADSAVRNSRYTQLNEFHRAAADAGDYDSALLFAKSEQLELTLRLSFKVLPSITASFFILFTSFADAAFPVVYALKWGKKYSASSNSLCKLFI